jgi:hypothetical protein
MKSNNTQLEVVGMTHIPSKLKAGEGFVVIVELNREVTELDENAQVVFQVQRLVPDIGGYPITRPASYDTYFDVDFLPKPIIIPVGMKFGTSNLIKVRKDVSAPDEEIPVRFPEKLLLSPFIDSVENGFISEVILISSRDANLKLSESFSFAADDLVLGQKVPNQAERDVVGSSTSKIKRNTAEFNALTKNTNADIVFKDEEKTGADQMMTTKLNGKVNALAALVKSEWSGVKLRITEAWDENDEHGTNSVHYEARAVDITTSDQDGNKLGRLGRLAVNAGFEWVFFENSAHVHASVSK